MSPSQKLTSAAFLADLNCKSSDGDAAVFQAYLRAAEAGDGAAAAKVSFYLRMGRGIKVDLVAATKWAGLASAKGFEIPDVIAKKKEKSIRRRSGKSILIVTADSEADAVVVPTLKRSGYPTYVVDTVSKACEKLEQHQDVGLVFVDLKLPEATGFNAVATMRSKRKTVACALMGGKASNDDIAQMRSMKLDGYLMKPFAGEEILAVVDRVCLKGRDQS